MSHLQNDIVTHAVADSKDKTTRRLILFLVVIAFLALGIASYTAFSVINDKQKTIDSLYTQVETACNDSVPNETDLEKLCTKTKEVVAGQTGPKGPKGDPGQNGQDGQDGVNGTNGRNGQNGSNGQDGLPGEKGDPGLPGKDGAKGDPGEPGEPGKDGKDGANGTNGIDAVPFTFTFSVNTPGGNEQEYSCTINAPDTTATCVRTKG